MTEPGFEEEMAFVCIREKVEDAWKHIEATINESFECSIRHRPFQADRAFFICRNDKELDRLKTKILHFLEVLLQLDSKARRKTKVVNVE